MDWATFLDSIWDKYERWQSSGRITHTSKVMPIGQSVEAKSWVMPTERVMHFLANSRSFALADCRCRTLGNHCDRPRDVCLLLNEISDLRVDKGLARRVSLDEAADKVKRANEAGLVPMTLYHPEQHVLSICHCCPCCCHDLQFLKVRGRRDLVTVSEYVAVQNPEACVDCGLCVERCFFEARAMQGERMAYDPRACYGCGLCVTTCPGQAVTMELRRDIQPARAGMDEAAPARMGAQLSGGIR